MPTSPITGTVTPSSSDEPAGHEQLTDLVGHLETFAAPRYASASAMTADIPSPATGQVAAVGRRLYVYNGTAWVPSDTGRLTRTTLAAFTITLTGYADVPGMSQTVPAGEWLLFFKGEAALYDSAQVSIYLQVMHDAVQAIETRVLMGYSPDRRAFGFFTHIVVDPGTTKLVKLRTRKTIAASASLNVMSITRIPALSVVG